MYSDQYAPVEKFEISHDAISLGFVRGFAGPATGTKPSALALIAGENTISSSAAVNFSPDAENKNVRLGWCGFEIGGFGQAVAFGQDIELRCMISGKVQARWDGAQLAGTLFSQRRDYLTVTDMLRQIRNSGVCHEIEQVLPFALTLVRSHGSRVYLETTFRYLLNRSPNSLEFSLFNKEYTTLDAINECWKTVMHSQEYIDNHKFPLPGPFNASFPFPLDILYNNQ